ncbi:uncharacterized protein LOC119104799 [Pollicipes pollicipes]|uniref:uncharacterized protein LOC119104799 n=1 Tax=Pollicipes pollicipes TaxID=41117 RepID=UPI0018858720|nr:uncharacterized protein LOC119104799 [Pollicipes pollicipes]
MTRPRTAKEFFYWTSVLVLLLVGCFQLFLSQQYFRKFGGGPCDGGNCTFAPPGDERALPASVSSQRWINQNSVDGRRLASGTSPRPAQLVPLNDPAPVNFSSAPLNRLEDPSRPVLLVIVSSAPRSGSTFLGEMMSSPRRSTFIFEPFWFYSATNSSEHLGGANASVRVDQDIYNLLTCRLSSLPPMFAREHTRSFIWRKPRLPRGASLDKLTTVCLKQSMRVVKTIRVRLHDVLPLLEVEGLNVHIVHLVRDPRGILNSILRQRRQWPERRRDPEYTCADMRDDIRSWRDVTSSRLSVVRYEDVAAHPLKEARRLFANMNVPLPPDVLKFIESHTKTSAKQKSSITKRSDKKDRKDSERTKYSSKQAHAPERHANAIRTRRNVAIQRQPTPLELFRRDAWRLRRITLDEYNKMQATRRRHTPLTSRYYGTFRSAQFDELHWTRELALGYPLRYPGETEGEDEAERREEDEARTRVPGGNGSGILVATGLSVKTGAAPCSPDVSLSRDRATVAPSPTLRLPQRN